MLGIIEIFLFLCVVYYLFGKRTGDMVDVMSTRLQEAYGSWSYNGFNWGDGGQRGEERPTFDFLRRFGERQRKKRAQEKETDKRTRESSLYEIKESVMQIPPLPQNMPQGLACRYCAPGSEIQLDPHERRRDVIDVLRTTQHVNQGPTKSWWNLATYFPILAQCLRVKKYHFPEVSPTVLKDKRVLDAIEQATIESVREERQAAEAQGRVFSDTETYTKMLEKQNKRARKVMKDMRAKMSNVLLQITSWIIYKLLPCFLTGAVAHPAQIEMLKAASRRTPNTPLIFLPLHRSHLDYVLVTFMLLNNDLRVPVIAAGNNLRIPFFGEALRGLGAFYIKRKIDPITGKKDIVYRAILNAYLQHCLTAGHNAEFFIEGGRTRTGKPCIPKGGILSVVVEAFLDKTVPDVLLVPVSVNYERLVDGNFVAEQLGQRKPPETFASAISAIWKAVKSNYGLMRIDFNEPFSLKELVDAFKRNQEHHTAPQRIEPGDRLLQQTKSSTSLYGTDIVQEDNRCLVDSIARHVVYDCASATSVMSTNAVTFLLLTQFRRGVTLSVFARALDRLRDDLTGLKDLGFTGNSEDIIKYVLELLGEHLITLDTINGEMFVKPVNTVPAMLELAYYANTLMPFYVLESVVTSAMYALLPQDVLNNTATTLNEKISLLEEDILELCHKFCDILRYEFILNKPCQDLDTLLRDTLHKMSDRDLISIPKKMHTEAELEAKRMHRRLLLNNDIEDDEDYVTYGYEEENVVMVDMNQRVHHVNSIAILAPIARTYLTVVDHLHRLLGNSQLEVEFIKGALAEVRQKFDNQECEFGESVSVEMIKNCLKLLEKWSVVQVECAGGVRLLSLTHRYHSSAGIEEVYHKIQAFNCISHFTFESDRLL
ncbi:glycerol-3-phosphate acyltransferase 1, mitochondrial isoform X1 [Lutzomyia longipalpis]|uniref:Putative glycerol-3-phosphate acyltransferase gpat n=2 Tax=Lutzomyia longipalpis TaxID=7200 RepID=A0A7G3ASR7_LUTLO|nr:glycerol-3-phosphate acyltransferase 1, mitochondrial isoform X1 [Lutzomyia longipalpis]